MLLNFQRQFAADVVTGIKRQTIRSAGKRVHVPRVGEQAHCYTGLRTRATKRLGMWPVKAVEVLRMDVTDIGLSNVVLGANRMTTLGLEQLAVEDGFKSAADMGAWFAKTHGCGEFYGWLIGWEWSAAGVDRAYQVVGQLSEVHP